MDPNTTNPLDPNPDPAAAAAAADTPPAAADAAPASPPAPEVDPFTAGMQTATEDGVALRVAPADAAPAAPAADGTTPPATEPKEGDPAAPATPPAAGQPPGTPPAAPAVDPAVEAEMKELGIDKMTERAQKRFHELSGQVKKIPELEQRAALVDDWVNLVSSTGATEEQFGATIGYLRAINSGDPAQMRKAYDQVLEEVTTLGKALGLSAPGVDPIAEHADLVKAVREGDMDRALAEELAARRAAERIQAASTTTAAQRQQQEQARTQETQQGVAAVAAFGQAKRASDPLFVAKFQAIKPMIEVIQDTLPPSQWAAAVQRAYDAAVVAPPAVPHAAAPPASASPLRPSGNSATHVRTPKNAEEAFSFGVDRAKAAGQ